MENYEALMMHMYVMVVKGLIPPSEHVHTEDSQESSVKPMSLCQTNSGSLNCAHRAGTHTYHRYNDTDAYVCTHLIVNSEDSEVRLPVPEPHSLLVPVSIGDQHLWPVHQRPEWNQLQQQKGSHRTACPKQPCFLKLSYPDQVNC